MLAYKASVLQILEEKTKEISSQKEQNLFTFWPEKLQYTV